MNTLTTVHHRSLSTDELLDLLAVAKQYREGELARIVCVACGDDERTMSIMIENGRVVWHCFRASCGASGAARLDGAPESTEEVRQRRKQKAHPYTGEIVPLSPGHEIMLRRKYSFTEEHFALSGARYAPDKARIAFPLFRPDRSRRGWMLRSFTQTPKALTRPDNADEPHLSWYKVHGPHSSLVIVEDIPSAVRVGLHVNAVALNGTGVSDLAAAELVAEAPPAGVWWALDADAFDKSLKLMRKYASLMPTKGALYIQHDFKDMTEENLLSTLRDAGVLPQGDDNNE